MLAIELNDQGNFKAAHNLSQPLAAFQWCMRGVMYMEMKRRSVERNPDLPNIIESCIEVMDEAALKLPSCPYRQVQIWLRKTHVVARTVSGDVRLMWAKDGITLVYQGTLISILRSGEMLRTVMDRIETKLEEEIFIGVKFPFEIPEEVNDDISDLSLEYNWLKHPENEAWLSLYGNDYFMRVILPKVPGIRGNMAKLSLGVSPEGKKWLIKLRELKIEIGVILKLVCGSSMRDTELFEILLENTANSKRSFFWLVQEMVMVSEYLKMSYQNEGNVTPHALFLRIAKVIAIYHVIIYPFELVLHFILNEDEQDKFHAYKVYLFSDD